MCANVRHGVNTTRWGGARRRDSGFLLHRKTYSCFGADKQPYPVLPTMFSVYPTSPLRSVYTQLFLPLAPPADGVM